MKMKLYYVVKVLNSSTIDGEAEYAAGPFSYIQASDYKFFLEQDWKYEIVEQEIEVN